MVDFNATLGQEIVQAKVLEREQEIRKYRWVRRLRELDAVERTPKNVRRLPLRGRNAAARRRALFIEGLDAAQREGITVDAWFGYRFADPELSARAEWAGLVDESPAKDGWAAA
jgi:hypothetical protein